MSFAQGLAQGLAGLPQALAYGQDRRRRREYQNAIKGLAAGNGPVDLNAASRIALLHGDISSALQYKDLAERRAAGQAAAKRQALLDAQALEDRTLKLEDRTRRITSEDEATKLMQREAFARRLEPLLQAGDTEAMGRLAAAHPGMISEAMNLGPGRRVTGIEAITTPEGEKRYTLQISNARTGTTGPQTENATAGPADTVVSFTGDQIMRSLQPYLPAPPKATNEQRNIAAFLARNPGATEADYFAQKRSPGVTVHTGDAAAQRPPSAAYDPQTGTEPGKDRAFLFNPETQEFERNELGLPVQVPNPGSAVDPATKTDESAIKVGMAATGGQFSLDVLSQKNEDGLTVYDELAKFGQHFMGKVPVFGNYLVSETYQKAYHAVTNFVEGQLRLASGAAVPEPEVDRYRELYSPVPGDTAPVIEQKMRALKGRVDFALEKAGQSPTDAAPEAAQGAPESAPPSVEAPGPVAPATQLEAPPAAPQAPPAPQPASPPQPAPQSAPRRVADAHRFNDLTVLSSGELEMLAEQALAHPELYTVDELNAAKLEWDRRGLGS